MALSYKTLLSRLNMARDKTEAGRMAIYMYKELKGMPGLQKWLRNNHLESVLLLTRTKSVLSYPELQLTKQTNSG